MRETAEDGSQAGDPADNFVLQHFYRPKPGDVLYHYCSIDAFEAIIRTGKLRFSDITMMNDASEMRWGFDVFKCAIEQFNSDEAPSLSLPSSEFLAEIEKELLSAQQFVHPVIACFSLHPDVLSQWRAYAADGRGVCIGFDATKLSGLPATFLLCEYDYQTQIERTKARLIAASSLGAEFTVFDHASHFFGYLPSLKNPCFREEGEVRAVHFLQVSFSDDGINLCDAGGECFGRACEPFGVEFSVRDHGLIAHVDLPFFDLDPNGVIREVVLGPKNKNPVNNVSALLTRYGHKGVAIKGSTATYR